MCERSSVRPDSAAAQELDHDDAALVERVRAGDPGAFRTLYHRYARIVAARAYWVVGDTSEVDDIVQETFIAAALGLDGLRDPSALKAWLMIIATRCAQRCLARRSRVRRTGRALRDTVPIASDPAGRASVEQLDEALDRLSPKLRVPWVLSRVVGEPLPTVARQCGVSLATVKRRLVKADRLLKRSLGDG
jgi:RNA polymerase sigma-70 factor (ECF subfamily)